MNSAQEERQGRLYDRPSVAEVKSSTTQAPRRIEVPELEVRERPHVGDTAKASSTKVREGRSARHDDRHLGTHAAASSAQDAVANRVGNLVVATQDESGLRAGTVADAIGVAGGRS